LFDHRQTARVEPGVPLDPSYYEHGIAAAAATTRLLRISPMSSMRLNLGSMRCLEVRGHFYDPAMSSLSLPAIVDSFPYVRLLPFGVTGETITGMY